MQFAEKSHSTRQVGMLWPVLGSVRFFLALVVAASHLKWVVPNSRFIGEIGYFSPRTAVFAFLFISGFSIACSYQNSALGFYTRRIRRIYPLYFVAVLGSVLLPVFLHGSFYVAHGILVKMMPWQTVLGNLFFLQGFFCYPVDTNVVVWTLSIEVFFYLLAPLIARFTPRTLLKIVCLFALVFISSRFFDLPHYSAITYGGNVFTLGWAWLLGFFCWHVRLRQDWVIWAVVIGIVSITLNNVDQEFLWPITWIVTILSAHYSSFVCWHPRMAQFLSFLGDLSYPLYLLHLPLYLFLYASGVKITAHAYLVISLIGSFVFERFYDRPIKKFFS